MNNKKIGVAVLGFGTVGSGVAQVLTENRDHIREKLGVELELKYILDVKDISHTPFGDRAVSDMDTILADREVAVVAEVIGGTGAALEYTRRALEAGKSVVTSNKELVALHGVELSALAREKGVCYLCEASVGGGIPLIHPLTACLCGNELTEVRGILNGTTNYILTRMFRDRLPFEAALAEAQEKGYAEADPTADVDGIDACRKICILATLAFGAALRPQDLPCEGIRGVTAADVGYAASQGYTIKLLGRALRGSDGRPLAYVAPHLVSREDPLASAQDVYNAVTVRGNAVGDAMFYGRGAGMLPTASAVVSDIMEAVREGGPSKTMLWPTTFAEEGPDADALVEDRWYLRTTAQPDTLRAALGQVTFLARQGGEGSETALLTAPMTRTALLARLGDIPALSLFRVLGD